MSRLHPVLLLNFFGHVLPLQQREVQPHNVAGRGLDITADAVQVRAPSQHGIRNHVLS